MQLRDMVAARSFLDQLQSHSALDAPEREAVLGLPGHIERVQTNRDFVRLGDRVDHACFVADGLVGRFGQGRGGERQIVAAHIAGDMADLHSVVVPKVSWALQALSPTTIIKVPHDALRARSDEHPALARAFWRQCVIDGSILAEWVVNVGRRDALSGLAHLICELAYRTVGRAPRDGQELPFLATQSHIGDMLGLTPVHVNRVLQALRRAGLIAASGSRAITILDWSELAMLGEFDPDYLHLPSVDEAAPACS